METVEQKHFFHTAATPNGEKRLDESQHRVIDATAYNPRHTELINYAPKIELRARTFGWIKYLEYLYDNFDGIELTKNNLQGIIEKTYWINSRYFERVFEQVRQAEFPAYPSRLNCIYLADAENLEFWHQKAIKESGLDALPIYEFSATGTVHYADPKWLEVDIVSDDEYKRVAREYWQGNNHGSTQHAKEILFLGELTTIAKYANIDEYRKAKQVSD